MRSKRRTLLELAMLGGVGAMKPAAAMSLQPVALHTLDGELRAIANAPACPLASLSVLAIRNGRVAYQFQYGNRVMPNGNLPLSPAGPATLYRIASVSKLMVALVAMMLVEEGKLDLEADLSAHLGFALRNPHFPKQVVKLRHLLSHTAGLRDDGGYSWPAEVTLNSVFSAAASNKMWASKAPPGAYFSYANLNSALVAAIIESVDKGRFDQIMRRRLLDPLNMRGGFNPSEFSPEDLANVATLYRKRTVDTELWDSSGSWIAQTDDFRTSPPARIAAPVRNPTPFSPAGGLRASAADLGAVMLILMNDGRQQNGRTILKPATLARMFRREWSYDGKGGNGDSNGGLFHGWGLGNQHFMDGLVEGGGFSAVGHHGYAYGLRSVFAADLASKNGMTMLVGGVGADPDKHPGSYSAMPRFQEQILTALYRRAILGKSD